MHAYLHGRQWRKALVPIVLLTALLLTVHVSLNTGSWSGVVALEVTYPGVSN